MANIHFMTYEGLKFVLWSEQQIPLDHLILIIPLTVVLRSSTDVRHDSQYSYHTLIKTKGETTLCGLYVNRKNKHRPKFRTGKSRKLSGGRAAVKQFSHFFSFSCCQKKQLPVRARLVLCHFLLLATMAALSLLYLVLCTVKSSH